MKYKVDDVVYMPMRIRAVDIKKSDETMYHLFPDKNSYQELEDRIFKMIVPESKMEEYFDNNITKKSEESQNEYRIGYMDCFVEALDMLAKNTKTAREFVEIAEKKFEGDTRVDLHTIIEEMN